MRALNAKAFAAITKPAPEPAPGLALAGIVRVLTCGSVDDGKSTLIGRLLWDASDVFDDQRAALEQSTRRVLDGKHLDYSLLVDGLLAEREQGITIDIAWRAFDTAERRFVIIDSPGHEQYTRNMASGASHADVAVMLIDARHGIKRQTRRHAAILDLFGVKRVVLAINKMDLVDWSEKRFRAIEADFRMLLRRFGFEHATAVPVAAVTGDNVAQRSAQMPWHDGPTLLEVLSTVPASVQRRVAFRFPVQMVLRDDQDFRGLAGTVAAGTIKVGDTITDVLRGTSAGVQRIATMDGDLASARRGQAVTLVLDSDLDISRGVVLGRPGELPTAARHLETRIVWLNEQSFDPKKSYLLRSATDSVPISRLEISSLLDLETLDRTPSAICGVNDIAVAWIDLGRAAALDSFAAQPETGSFILIDAVSGATVAGGIIVAVSGKAEGEADVVPEVVSDGVFVLTRAMLAQDLCADLAGEAHSGIEFKRREQAVLQILRAAGVIARIDSASSS